VAQVVLDLEAGGLERLVADLVRRADRDRFEMHLVALDFLGRYAEGLEAYATLHRSPPLGAWTMLWPGPLVRLFRSIAPDVVHTHSGVWYKASLAARRAGVPRLIHTEHGRPRWPYPWRDRVVERLAARRTDVVAAVSADVAGQLAHGIVTNGAKLRVIPNGVDTERFRPLPDDGSLRRELGVGPDVPIVGSIGRLDPIKGYDVVLRAFARCREGWAGPGPTPVLVLAGDGPERPSLEALAAELGVREATSFLGWRSDVETLLRAFTLYTLGSRSEGTSVGLLEAMSAGVCPVVTAVGGNPAVLGAELAPRLVPAERPEALAAAWSEALSARSKREADGEAARRRVKAEFSLAAMVRAYEQLYTSAPAPA
jgi:glycosyltransferase involved in cell wall biosynthesis